MEYKIFTKDLEITPAIDDYIAKRMMKPDRILKYHDDLVTNAEVRVKKDGGIYKVEVTSKFKKFSKIVRVESKGGDLYEVIDDVTDSFERMIRKLKTRLQDHFSQLPEPMPVVEAPILPEEDVEEPKPVAKKKRYDLSIMTPDEALLQTELLDHEFFVYRNADTDEVNVIYKRDDGKLGMIEFND